MATPNQTPTNLKDSLSIGSTEDFDICCDPCLKDDHRSEAKAFCQQCLENLCTTCLTVHRRLGVLKDHILENKPRKLAAKSAIPKDPQNICTEACTIHKNEVIKFCCQQHNTLGCNDCMTLDHRTCDITYIPNVCDGVTKSEEYGDTLKKLTEAIQSGMKFEQQIKGLGTKRKQSIAKALTEIESFKRRVNGEIKTLKKRLEQKIKSQESNDDRQEDKLLNDNQTLISELKSLQATLQISETNGQEARVFTAMKQAQDRLTTFAWQQRNFREEELKTYTFVPNRQIEDIISSSRELGEILSSSDYTGTHDLIEIFIGGIVHEYDRTMKFSVQTVTDKSTCDINGCAALSRQVLMLTDWNNQKIKILDLAEESIVDECSLSSNPFDVIVLPQNQAAITMPIKNKIQILSTTGKVKPIRSINTNSNCYGISCYQDLLFVACQAPASVRVLDMQGILQQEISVDTLLKEETISLRHIVINTNQQLVYVSTLKSSGVVSMSLEGTVVAVYKHEELQEPDGLTIFEDGSLLVCSRGNDTIHHISEDLKHGRRVRTPKAQLIYYHIDDLIFYVGRRENNFLFGFQLDE